MPSGKIKIDLAPSLMRAFVTVSPEESTEAGGASDFLSVEEILLALREQGVTFGILQEQVKELVTARSWGIKTLVAKGVDPLHGEDGWVEYSFDTSTRPHPKQSENGSVDYREIGLVHRTVKDQVLARVVPPKNGIPGSNVCGAEVPARAGAQAFIQAGLNTYFAEAQRRELRAQIAGAVSLVRGAVQVEETYTIKGDVDYATGNVDFPGNVIIYQDVKSGFKVRSGGKVEIRGVVEDAVIEARGDVMVKGGFEGSGKGFIRSGGSVHLKFIENQTVEAEGSIHIGEVVVNARVTTKDSLFLTTGLGTVIGGHLKAQGGITVKVLGNTHNTLTIVEIFQEEVSGEKGAAKEQHIAELQKKISSRAPVIAALQRRKAADPVYAQEIEAELNHLYHQLQGLKADLDAAQAEVNDRKVKIEKVRQVGKVHVLNRIYPGVELKICGLPYSFEAECGKTVVKLSGSELIVQSQEGAVLTES